MKYAWINNHRTEFPITVMCGELGVSRAEFYASLGQKPSQLTQRGDRVREAVAQVYAETDAIYGAAKIAAELKELNDLESACRNTVAKAMKKLGVASKVRRRSFRPTTTKADPSKRPAANVLNREFTATGPDQKWVTEITYVGTNTAQTRLTVGCTWRP